MSQEFTESISPTVGLMVGMPPYGEIIDFRVPIAAHAGDPVDMAILVRNVGDIIGLFHIVVWSEGVLQWESPPSEYINIAPGGQNWFYCEGQLTMPNHDYTLLAEARHDHIVDSSSEKTVPLITVIATTLTLTLTPTKVEPGGSYTYSGRLTRDDTGTGLAGQNIILQRNGAFPWPQTEVGRATTDADGNYSGTITAPTTVGDYSCRSMFQGTIIFGASISDIVGFTIPSLLELAWWQWGLLIGWAALGGVGLAVGRK